MTSVESERRSWLELALSCCDETDAIARAAFRTEMEPSRKPDATFVTATDLAVERRLRERIRAAHPDHGLVGEEYGSEDAERAVRWYVDPIDGTNNFLRGVPVFATLLAVERDGTLEAAVVSAPALGTRWVATRGGGAWSVRSDGRRRLAVSAIETIEEMQLLYSAPRSVRASGLVPGFDGVAIRAWRERGFGDFWGHMLIAEGAAEAMLEVGLKTWDIAAPMLIVEEAGGRSTDLSGEARVAAAGHLSSNGLLHDHLLAALTDRAIQ